MRWTKPCLAAALTLPLLACGKSAATLAGEVRSCSAITIDAQGAAQCLVLQYKWRQKKADSAATAFQRQQDSSSQGKADSAWRAEGARHAKEAEGCARDPSGEVARCLVGYGWAEARAAATADSLWRHDAARHHEELARCSAGRKLQVGSCLQLYYKWSPERALAVDDSIRRARMKR